MSKPAFDIGRRRLLGAALAGAGLGLIGCKSDEPKAGYLGVAEALGDQRVQGLLVLEEQAPARQRARRSPPTMPSRSTTPRPTPPPVAAGADRLER